MADKKSDAAQVYTPTPAPVPKQTVVTTYQDQKIVARRPSRAGDPGYELSTIYDQVTITLEDGTECVVKSTDLVTPA